MADNDYFHWELAFPEVFFDEYGRSRHAAAGFDAVIGNPPYVRQEQLTLFKPFFSGHFETVYAGTADLFVFFFKQAVNLLREDGLTSYISSNSWLRANYATNMRAYLRQNTTFETIIDLGDNRVFADAPDLYPAIHVVRRNVPPEKHTAQTASFNRGEGLSNFQEQLAQKLQSVIIHSQPDSGWQLDDTERKLFEKIMALGERLEDVINGRMYRGVLTGLNDAFIIDQNKRDFLIGKDPRNSEILKPLLRGADLRPWYQAFEGEWLIFSRRGIDIEQYPAVKEYLATFQERLEPRPSDYPKEKKWPGRKAGAYQWYELQDAIDYYQEFDAPKIFWPDISKVPRFSYDDEGCYCNDKGFIAVTNEKYVLGVLRSRVIWFCISNLCVSLGERAGLVRYQQKSQFISKLPIPNTSPENKKAIDELVTKATEASKLRYQLHEQIRHRILTDLGTPKGTLNNALTAWWDLNFPTFRAQIKKVFKRDIPLKERDEWELFLADARQQHQQLTSQIITLETELNQHVYTLFHLTPEEIQIIETSTKYPYGEV